MEEYKEGQRRTGRKINKNIFCLKYAIVKPNAECTSRKKVSDN